MSDRSDNFIVGVVIGGVIGALIGILFAPKSGKELRGELSEKTDDILQKAKEEYKEALEKSAKAYDATVTRLNKLEAAAGEKFEELGGKASAMLKKENPEKQ